MNGMHGLQGQGHTATLNMQRAKQCRGHTGGKQLGKISITT